MTFIRRIKKENGTYLAEVKSVRVGDKIQQKFIRYVGKEVEGQTVRKVFSNMVEAKNVKRNLDVLTIDQISNALGINDSVNNNHIMALVYSQILEQRSVNKLSGWLDNTVIPEILGADISTKKLYNSLSDLSECDFRKIEEDIYSMFESYKKEKSAAVIDVTDVYFEGSSQKVKSRRGKDGKTRKLVQLGLATTLKEGFPIFHKTYHGNVSNFDVYKDMIIPLKKDYNVVIMDRGFLCQENLKLTLSLNTQIIAGLRKSPKLVEQFIENIKRDSIFSAENRVKLKNTSVYLTSFDYMDGKLLIIYNPSLEVLKKEINFEKGKDTKNHIGYSLIYHNSKLDDKEVVRRYYNKEIVERAFKQIKGVLNVRPVRVWLREHVIGHMRVCYLAYSILALMNYRLKSTPFSVLEVLDSFKQGYKVNLKDKDSKFTWDVCVTLEPKQKKMLKALDVVIKK